MFIDGVNIMILGTGIVFLFLIVICLSMIVSSKLIQKFHLFFSPAPLHVAGCDSSSNDDELIAVISAAIACRK